MSSSDSRYSSGALQIRHSSFISHSISEIISSSISAALLTNSGHLVLKRFFSWMILYSSGSFKSFQNGSFLPETAPYRIIPTAANIYLPYHFFIRGTFHVRRNVLRHAHDRDGHSSLPRLHPGFPRSKLPPRHLCFRWHRHTA